MRFFQLILFFVILCNVVSCGRNDRDAKLQQALDLAGDNRAELESVLEYYKGDSLKYEAAKYLIENSPYNYAYHGWQIDSIAVADSIFSVTGSYDRDRFYYLFPLDYASLEVVFDVAVLTKEYLIENIEYAFRAWKEKPWNGQVSFETFKRFILPYRLGNEPLTRWRKHYYDKYSHAIDSLYVGDSVLVAGLLAEGYTWSLPGIYNSDLSVPNKDAMTLDKYNVGSCVEISDFHQNILRAVGIPAITECYLYSPNIQFFHAWNSIIDSSGQSWMLPYSRAKGASRTNKGYKYGKVYRRKFESDYNRMLEVVNKETIPPLLRNDKMDDVTAEYFEPNSVEVDFGNTDTKYGCLGVYTHYGWDAVTMAEINGGKAVFTNIQPEVLFIPMLFENGRYSYIGIPFILDEHGNKVVFEAQSTLDSVRLNRKYITRKDVLSHMNRMYLGKFQGANCADFSDSVTLYSIDHRMVRAYFDVKIDDSRHFRYLRYISAPKKFGDIGTLVFYDENGAVIKGALSSSKPYETKSRAENAIDDDPLTYFSSSESEGWIALTLDKPQRISSIRYSARHDDNFIRKGDSYELYFFDKGKWEALGSTMATDTILVYKTIPANCLYLLKNHTRGREIRPFIYRDGKQVFY